MMRTVLQKQRKLQVVQYLVELGFEPCDIVSAGCHASRVINGLEITYQSVEGIRPGIVMFTRGGTFIHELIIVTEQGTERIGCGQAFGNFRLLGDGSLWVDDDELGELTIELRQAGYLYRIVLGNARSEQGYTLGQTLDELSLDLLGTDAPTGLSLQSMNKFVLALDRVGRQKEKRAVQNEVLQGVANYLMSNVGKFEGNGNRPSDINTILKALPQAGDHQLVRDRRCLSLLGILDPELGIPDDAMIPHSNELPEDPPE